MQHAEATPIVGAPAGRLDHSLPRTMSLTPQLHCHSGRIAAQQRTDEGRCDPTVDLNFGSIFFAASIEFHDLPLYGMAAPNGTTWQTRPRLLGLSTIVAYIVSNICAEIELA